MKNRAFLCGALVALGCGDGNSAGGGTGGAAGDGGSGGAVPEFYPGYSSSSYLGDERWFCRPGKDGDHCSKNLDATEVLADGTFRLVTHDPAPDPAFDCFYIYPTTEPVDGLDEDFSEPNTELDPLLGQIARFNSLCRIHAPFYRQVGLNAVANRDALMPMAYADVIDAFKHYMANDNGGRPFVLAGHSQGTRHLTRLVQEEIDTNEQLRARMISALLIGGGLTVPVGRDVGGTFDNVPLCTSVGQSGCFVHYNTFPAEGAPPDIPISLYGRDETLSDGTMVQAACADPRALAGNGGRLRASYYPTSMQGAIWPVATGGIYDGITTPFVLIRNAFRADCVRRDGFNFFEVTVEQDPGDVRSELPHRALATEVVGFGMHTSDWQTPMGDLLDMVRKQWEGFSSAN